MTTVRLKEPFKQQQEEPEDVILSSEKLSTYY